jgi:ribosomal protein S18 acetylase RimI-like enzyme
VTGPFTVAPLESAHDRQGFSCGVAALDRYLHQLVGQDVRRRISNCFVALDPAGAIAGYYTLAATSLPMVELDSDVAKRLPRYPLLPAALVGRLAVDRRFQGQGLGGALMVNAIARAMRAEPAIFALIVDAKDDAAVRFYEHHGFHRFISRPQTLFLPIAEAVRRLAVRR